MMESIHKTENGGHQPQDRPEQLSATEDIDFIDDVLNAVAKVEHPKSSQKPASRTSVEDYCSFPEKQDQKAFLYEWNCIT
jgi:hypothetical protein